MRQWAMWAMVMGCVVGCAEEPAQSCGTLAWSCGTDDTGRVCGVCGDGLTCREGACEVPVFGACEVGVSRCAPMPDAGPSRCVVGAQGRAYCQPVCLADADCDKWSGASGRFECRPLADGALVCQPR